jgi:hypothetical protein
MEKLCRNDHETQITGVLVQFPKYFFFAALRESFMAFAVKQSWTAKFAK